MSKKYAIITIVAVAVVFGAGGFFGGMQYQKSKSPALTSFGNGQRTFANGARNGGVARVGNFTGGQILSMDSKSITVKAQDGSSRIVFYSGSTEINKPTTIDASQLAVGDNVIVAGTNNSDGSITANNIQVRPAGQNAPMMRYQGGQSSSTSAQQ